MTEHLLNPSEDAKFEAAYNHYVDSVGVVRVQIKLRDRLLVIAILLLAVMSFQIFLPQESGNVLSEFARKKLDVEQGINLAFLGTVIWFALLATAVRYFQVVVGLERQYDYIHELEDHLSKLYTAPLFTREGRSYLHGYPMFSNWVWALYTIAFPLSLILAVAWKMAVEFTTPHVAWLALLSDLVISAMIVISTIFYLLHIHKRR